MTEFEILMSRYLKYNETIIKSYQSTINLIISPSVTQVMNKLSSDAKRVSEMINRLDMSSVLAQLNKSKPQNYYGLKIDDQFQIIDLSKRANFGTVEIAPKEVLKGILTSDGSIVSMDEILLETADLFIMEGRNLVSKLQNLTALADFSYLYSKTIDAFEDGHFEASQTLSTTIWDSYLCMKAGNSKPITNIKPHAQKPNINQIEDFAPLYDYGAYAPAFNAYVSDSNKQMYSRDATVHRNSRKAMNKLNALKALSVSGGILGRQLDGIKGE